MKNVIWMVLDGFLILWLTLTGKGSLKALQYATTSVTIGRRAFVQENVEGAIDVRYNYSGISVLKVSDTWLNRLIWRVPRYVHIRNSAYTLHVFSVKRESGKLVIQARDFRNVIVRPNEPLDLPIPRYESDWNDDIDGDEVIFGLDPALPDIGLSIWTQGEERGITNIQIENLTPEKEPASKEYIWAFILRVEPEQGVWDLYKDRKDIFFTHERAMWWINKKIDNMVIEAISRIEMPTLTELAELYDLHTDFDIYGR